MRQLNNRRYLRAIPFLAAAAGGLLASTVQGDVVTSPSNLTIGLQLVGNTGGQMIDEATIPHVAGIPDNPLLYIAQQNSTGTINAFNPVTGTKTQFLTFTGSGVSLTGEFISGITFAPGYSDPTSLGYHKLFTFETEVAPAATSIMYLHPEVPNPTAVGVVREWTANADGLTVNNTSSRVVLNFGINNTSGVHAGGGMKFGPDGYLYLAIGDSGDGGNGSGNDFAGTINNATDGHTGRGVPTDNFYVPPIGNGQDFTNLLGKVIRIDPLLPASGDKADETAKMFNNTVQYYIPNSNPFVGDPQHIYFTNKGPVSAQTPAPPLTEIYAFGFRNPWKLSFDANAYNTPLIPAYPLVAHVGQQTREAIDLVQPGKDYGWPYNEGGIASPTAGVAAGRPSPVPFLMLNSDGSYSQYTLDPTLTDPTQMQGPLAEYTTRTAGTTNNIGDGSAVTGGFIYRGTKIPALYGMYVFGDYELRVSGTPVGGRLFYLDPNENSTLKTIHEFNYLPGKGITGNANGDLLGFAQGADNELYAMFANGDVKEIVVAPEPASLALLGMACAGLLMRRSRRKA